MKIPFEKWHGCRNDFMVFWLKSSEMGSIDGSLKRRAITLCSKMGDGVGADGILILEVEKANDYLPKSLTIINADGSLAKNCGNGLRCAAGSILQKSRVVNDTELQTVMIPVLDKKFSCQFLLTRKNQLYPFIGVSMAQTLVDDKTSWFVEIKKECEGFLIQSGIAYEKLHGVDTYNQHIVVFVKNSLDDRESILRCARAFQVLFSGDGINVHFVRENQIDQAAVDECSLNTGAKLVESFTAFVYERGVGVTQACGSGAVAIASTVIQEGFINKGECVGVEMPGGKLYVSQNPEQELKLVGPAVKIYDGILDI